MSTLYTPGTMIFKLREQFLKFLSGLGKPMRQHLLTLAFAILALNGFQSVKASYDRFMSRISARRLKSYYYALSQGDISLDVLMNNLVRTALELTDKEGKQAIIISIDDTLVEKFGQAFAYRSKLFDHAAHNGSNYLNGHCFVSLLIAVPIKDDTGCRYIPCPVAYRMWTREQTKLEMAAELVRSVMKIIGTDRQVILCCDSWYPKGAVKRLIDEFSNLALICNVRIDTAMYDLPPEKTGKRGRPKERGDKIRPEDVQMEDVPGAKYRAGTKAVKTRLFGGRVMYAIVTQTKSEKGYRLFLCSENPEKLCFDLEFLKNEHALAYARHDISLLPLTIYSMRWAIEVSYYEQKQFWALGDYMLRTRNGIERLINLQTLVYAYVKLLPYLSKDFSCLKECSPQQTRFVLGSLVQQQIFLSTLPLPLEDIKNSVALGDFFQAQLLSFISAA